MKTKEEIRFIIIACSLVLVLAVWILAIYGLFNIALK